VLLSGLTVLGPLEPPAKQHQPWLALQADLSHGLNIKKISEYDLSEYDLNGIDQMGVRLTI